MRTHRNLWMLVVLLLVCSAAAFAQEAQEQPVPAQRVVAQDGKAQDSEWIIGRSDQTSSISVRLDSLVADTLYVSKGYGRKTLWKEQSRRVQSLYIGDIERIRYSPLSSTAWCGAGGALLGLVLTLALVPNATHDRLIGYGGEFAGLSCGMIIGGIKYALSQDIYDLTKKTTAEKWLLITDLLVSGASSRK